MYEAVELVGLIEGRQEPLEGGSRRLRWLGVVEEDEVSDEVGHLDETGSLTIDEEWNFDDAGQTPKAGAAITPTVHKGLQDAFVLGFIGDDEPQRRRRSGTIEVFQIAGEAKEEFLEDAFKGVGAWHGTRGANDGEETAVRGLLSKESEDVVEDCLAYQPRDGAPWAATATNLRSVKFESDEMVVEVRGEDSLDSPSESIHCVFSDGERTQDDGVVEVLEGTALVDVEEVHKKSAEDPLEDHEPRRRQLSRPRGNCMQSGGGNARRRACLETARRVAPADRDLAVDHQGLARSR